MRKPRFKKGEWVIEKATVSLCLITAVEQPRDKHHRYTVLAPTTAARFTGKESEFRKLTGQERKNVFSAERRENERRWERLLAKGEKASE